MWVFCRFPDTSTSVDTVINYLIGIALGDVLFSILMAILLAAPVLIHKGYRVQKVVVRTAKKVSGQAHGAVKAAFPSHLSGNVHELEGPEEPQGQVMDHNGKDGHYQLSVPEDEETGTLDPGGAPFGAATGPLASAGAPRSENGKDHVSVDGSDGSSSIKLVHGGHGLFDGHAGWLWLAFLVAMYIAGTVLIILGIDYVSTNSVLSFAVDSLNLDSVASTLNLILITGLCLIGVCDIISVRLLCSF